MKKYYDALLYTFTFILIQVTASVIENIAIKMAHGTNCHLYTYPSTRYTQKYRMLSSAETRRNIRTRLLVVLHWMR